MQGLFGGLGGFKTQVLSPAVPLASERTAGGVDNCEGSQWSGWRAFELHNLITPQEVSAWKDLQQACRAGTADQIELRNPEDLAAATLVALQSYGKPKEDSLKDAREALRLHPNCPEAYALMGIFADTLEEALALYRMGEQVGREIFTNVTSLVKDGDAWNWVPARGYMRCLLGIANTLRKLHAETQDAAAATESLVILKTKLQRMQSSRLSSSGYVNFAALLPEAHLRCNDTKGLKKLWADQSIAVESCNYISSMVHWIMSRALQDYREDPGLARWQWIDHTYRESMGLGDSEQHRDDFDFRVCRAGGAVFLAMNKYPLVIDLLSGKKKLPAGSLPLVYFQEDSLEQAVTYVHSAGDLWDENARHWLISTVNTMDLLDDPEYYTANTLGSLPTKGILKLINQGVHTGDIGPVQKRVPGPLHKATYYDLCPEIINALLEAGMNPFQTGGPSTGPDEGATPLAMAAGQGNARALRVILEFCDRKYSKERVISLMADAVSHMLISSVYFCAKGLARGCQRCSFNPHSPFMSFEECLDVLVEMGLRRLLPPSPYEPNSHPLRQLLTAKIARSGKSGEGSGKSEKKSGKSGVPKEERRCSVCSASSGASYSKLRLCSGCKGALYCSTDCQKKDWPRHKAECHKAGKGKK